MGDGGKREPFLTPDGRFGVSPAVDTMYNLPRGSKVWSSIQKFKSQASNNDYLKSFMNQLPKFAMGTQKSFLDSPKMPNVFSQREGVSNHTTINNEYVSTTKDNMDYEKLSRAIVKALVDGDVKVEMDKRQFGRLVGEFA